MARSPLMNVMVQAATKAGRGMRRDFGEVEQLQVSIKGPSDFVSAADRKAEEIVMKELQKARPEIGFLLEEGGAVSGSDPSQRFIIDPIDGTTNFMHGIPQFAISIALEREGQLVSGLVFNPASDELYLAERGHGAYLNDRRLRVAARKNLSEILVASGAPFMGKDGRDEFLAELDAILSSTAGMRRFGAASLDLASVAAGRCDAFWERNLQAWDVAAGILLVREAGGAVSDLKGRDNALPGDILATNEHLQRPLLQLLRGANRTS